MASEKKTSSSMMMGGAVIVIIIIAAVALYAAGAFGPSRTGPSVSSTVQTTASTSSSTVASTTASTTSIPARQGLAGVCTGTSAYSCTNMTLSNSTFTGPITYAGSGTLNNVTFYAISENYSFLTTQESDYPHSQQIPALVSGQSLNVTIGGGSGSYVLPSKGGFIGYLWVTYSEPSGQNYTKVGTLSVNPH